MVKPHDNEPDEQRQRMECTRGSTLAVVALASAAVAWLGVDQWYGSLPDLPWLPPMTFLALAVFEAYVAWQVRAWLGRRRGATPIPAIVVARYVVLAKASAFVGAMFGGLYLATTTWLAVQRAVLVHAASDLPASIAGGVGSGALLVCSILLERSCRVPGPPQGGNEPPHGRRGARTGE